MESLIASRVNVMVSDMDRAVQFYSGILGLEVVNRYGNHYAEIQAADLMIGLHPSSEKVTFGSNMSIGFGVTDFDKTIVALEKKGIQFRPENDGWIRLAHFKDPDNNQLYLAENKG